MGTQIRYRLAYCTDPVIPILFIHEHIVVLSTCVTASACPSDEGLTVDFDGNSGP